MKLILFFLFSAVRAASTDTEEDHPQILSEVELDQFLEVFNLPKVADPVEKKKRAEILKKNQEKVLEANKAFLAGNQTWREEINEFSHLTQQEFLASHTGLGLPPDNDTLASLASLSSPASLASLYTEERTGPLQGPRLTQLS